MSVSKELLNQIQVNVGGSSVKSKCVEFINKKSEIFDEYIRENSSEINPDVVAMQSNLQREINRTGPQIHQVLTNLIIKSPNMVRLKLPITDNNRTRPAFCYFNIDYLSQQSLELLKGAIPLRTMNNVDIISGKKVRAALNDS